MLVYILDKSRKARKLKFEKKKQVLTIVKMSSYTLMLLERAFEKQNLDERQFLRTVMTLQSRSNVTEQDCVHECVRLDVPRTT